MSEFVRGAESSARFPEHFRAPPRRDRGLHLAPSMGMPASFRRSLPIAGVAVLMTAALALAVPPASAAPHVRPETSELQALLDDLVSRSPTAKRLVDRLNDSNVIVYVRHRPFTTSTLEGRIGIVASGGGSRRYLVIELACGRPPETQLATFGHELQHAVEIARAGDVIDARTLAQHYLRIGFRVSSLFDAFETEAALDTSVQVRREVAAANGWTPTTRRGR